MKRRQNIQKYFKETPRRDLRSTSRTRQRNTDPGRAGFSLDPDYVCVSSDSSVESKTGAEGNQTLTSSPSDAIDLTGISERVCKTKCLVNGNPAPNSGDVVVLSDSREDEVSELETEETMQTSVTPGLAGKAWLTCPLNKVVPGRKLISDSSLLFPTEGCAGFDSQLDDSLSDDILTSGPTSPCNNVPSLKCRECKNLFSRMKRRGPSNAPKRNNDPASLSCDNWLLTKPWHPQRQRQEKGRLWLHLKRIRKLSAECSDSAVMHTAHSLCSRIHVFLQRNLRRCRESSATLKGASESHVVSKSQRRHRAKSAWPPVRARHRRQNSRASLERSSIVAHVSAPDLSVDGSTLERGAPRAALQRQGKALERRGAGFLRKRAETEDMESTQTQWVLRFDNTPSLVTMETQEPKQGCVQGKSTEGRLSEGPVDLTLADRDSRRGLQNGLLEHSNGFRTPLESSSIGSEVVSKRQSSRAMKNSSFRSMLLALQNSRNQVIKETDT